jgi:hypothetical protein
VFDVLPVSPARRSPRGFRFLSFRFQLPRSFQFQRVALRAATDISRPDLSRPRIVDNLTVSNRAHVKKSSKNQLRALNLFVLR